MKEQLHKIILYCMLGLGFLIVISQKSTMYAQNRETETYTILTVPELIHEAILTEDSVEFSSICHYLNDSLLANRDAVCYLPEFCVEDNNSNYYIFFSNEMCSLPFDWRKLLSISVGKGENSDVIPLETLADSLNVYMLQPDSICHCYQTVYTKLWGRIMLPQRGIHLSMKISPDKESLNVYSTFFQYLRKINLYHNDKLNRVSYQKWGKSFDRLSTEQRFEVVDYFRLLIVLHFYKE